VLKPLEPPQNAVKVANGVWVHNGAFSNFHTDFQVRSMGFDFQFVRHYRSSNTYDGIMGQNWDHSYNVRVVPTEPPGATQMPGGWIERYPGVSGNLWYYHGTGRVTFHPFVKWQLLTVLWCTGQFDAIVTTYAQNPGEDFEIQRYAVVSGSLPENVQDPIFYRIRRRGGVRLLLNCHGYVVQIRDRNFNRMRFRYGGPFNPSTNYTTLDTIIDTQNRMYKVEYKLLGEIPRIAKLTDFGGRKLEFDYDGAIQLETATLVEGQAGRPVVRYKYEPTMRPGMLHAIVNPVESAVSGEPYLVNESWDSDERIVKQRVGDGASAGGLYEILYDANPPALVTVKDRNGLPWKYALRNSLVYSMEVEDTVWETGAPAEQLVSLLTKYDYDDNCHMIELVAPSGRTQAWQYRPKNQFLASGNEELDSVTPPFVHENDLSRDDLLWERSIPLGGEPAVENRYENEPVFNSLLHVFTPFGDTHFLYDHGKCRQPERNGNPIRITYPSQKEPSGPPRDVIDVMEYGVGGTRAYWLEPDAIEHTYIRFPTGLLRHHLIGAHEQESADYDDFGNLVWRRDSRGAEWRYDYDDRDLLIAEKDPLWDENVDPDGHVVFFMYDLNDRLKTKRVERFDDETPIKGTTPDPRRKTIEIMSYNCLGNLTSRAQVVTTPATRKKWSRKWVWRYDPEERRTLEQSPRAVNKTQLDAQVGWSYNTRGLQATRTPGEGGTNSGSVKIYYDSDGQLTRTEDAMGNVHETSYDAYGRVSLQVGPDGTKIHHEYDGVYLKRQWVEGSISFAPGQVETHVLRETVLQLSLIHILTLPTICSV